MTKQHSIGLTEPNRRQEESLLHDLVIGSELPITPDPDPALIGNVQKVGIKYIRPSSHNPREKDSLFGEEFARLKRDIEKRGILTPLVGFFENGSVHLIAGHRRLTAAKDLSQVNVPVILLDPKISDLDKRLAILLDNDLAQGFNPLERARYIQDLINDFNLTKEEVAEKINVGVQTITNSLCLLELPQNIQDKLRSGHLSQTDGVALVHAQKIARNTMTDPNQLNSHLSELAAKIIGGRLDANSIREQSKSTNPQSLNPQRLLSKIVEYNGIKVSIRYPTNCNPDDIFEAIQQLADKFST